MTQYTRRPCLFQEFHFFGAQRDRRRAKMERGDSPFFFSYAVYRYASQLTKRVEESKTDSISLHVLLVLLWHEQNEAKQVKKKTYLGSFTTE